MSAQAFIAFLKCEANQAAERAKSLRATAAAIEANAGSEDSGRKKRKARDPSKPKRSHTAYTLYVHENYELIKKNQDPNIPSKDIISLVAKQWAETSEEDKQLWKDRALAHKVAHESSEAGAGDMDEMLETDGAEDLEDGDKGKKRRATKKVAKMTYV